MMDNNDNLNHLDNNNLNATNSKSIHEKYADAYVKMLNTYETEIKKTQLKEKYFYLIRNLMIVMIMAVVASLIASMLIFILMICKGYKSVAVITGAITALITAVSPMVLSIFKLPDIIAGYLFNKDEDNSMSEIIQNIQRYEIESTKLDDIKERKLKENTSSNVEDEDSLSSLSEVITSDPESITSPNVEDEDSLSSSS